MAALTPDLDGDSGAEDAPLRYTSTSGPRYPPSTATFAHAQDYRYPTQPPQAHNRRTGALRFILNPPTSAMDHQTPDARPKWEPPATALAGAPSAPSFEAAPPSATNSRGPVNSADWNAMSFPVGTAMSMETTPDSIDPRVLRLGSDHSHEQQLQAASASLPPYPDEHADWDTTVNSAPDQVSNDARMKDAGPAQHERKIPLAELILRYEKRAIGCDYELAQILKSLQADEERDGGSYTLWTMDEMGILHFKSGWARVFQLIPRFLEYVAASVQEMLRHDIEVLCPLMITWIPWMRAQQSTGAKRKRGGQNNRIGFQEKAAAAGSSKIDPHNAPTSLPQRHLAVPTSRRRPREMSHQSPPPAGRNPLHTAESTNAGPSSASDSNPSSAYDTRRTYPRIGSRLHSESDLPQAAELDEDHEVDRSGGEGHVDTDDDRAGRSDGIAQGAGGGRKRRDVLGRKKGLLTASVSPSLTAPTNGSPRRFDSASNSESEPAANLNNPTATNANGSMNNVPQSAPPVTATPINVAPSTHTSSARDLSRWSQGRQNIWRLQGKQLPEQALKDNIHPLNSHCASPDVDLRFLGQFDVTAVELLTFFPRHTIWRRVIWRLRNNGWSDTKTIQYILWSRGITDPSAVKATALSHQHDGAREWAKTQTPPLAPGPVSQFDFSTTDSTRGRGSHGRISDLEDYRLVDLAEGVHHWPNGSDARVLTRAILLAVDRDDDVCLSGFAQYVDTHKDVILKGLSPVVQNGINPDAEAAARFENHRGIREHSKAINYTRK